MQKSDVSGVDICDIVHSNHRKEEKRTEQNRTGQKRKEKEGKGRKRKKKEGKEKKH
jgi:hypothetical protein